ncbi:choice-of-anchor D domain-containing protein, partial [bacterium]|nr:choice-of-anchor D domain-containing protein [bacterium]
AWSVYATDIDGDGDMDVLGAAYGDADITWWENDGEQDFTEHTIAGDFDGAYSVYAADIDGDGDMDVLGAAYGADDIIWWESNLNPPIPVIVVDADSLDFGEVLFDESKRLTLTVSNEGEAELVIPDIRVTGEYFRVAYAVDFNGNLIIAPDEDAVIQVTFAPEEAGESNGTITISSNDPRNREVEVEVTGTGVGINDPPEIVSPIEDIVLDEDFEPFVIANLDTVFSDPNDDELTYDAESDNENLTAEIIDESLLGLSVESNWFGEAVVTVTADDGVEERDLGPVRSLRRIVNSNMADKNVCPTINLGGDQIFTQNSPFPQAETPVLPGNRIFTQNSKFKIQNSLIPHRDLSTELLFTVTVTPVNDDPVWVSLPDDTIEVDADQHVGFDLEASDVDNEDLTITAELPEGSVLNDDGRGHAVFSWQTLRNDAGEYDITFTLSDGEAQIDFELMIIVSSSRTPVYFTDFDTTDASHHLIISLMELYNQEARTGWEVGVFTPDDLLAGAGVWFEGEALTLEAWADDPNTGDVEGFTDGESFTFKVWVSDEDVEYEAFGFFEEGPDSWEEDATSTVFIMGIEPGEIRVLFAQGWNMVSINIAPAPEMYREGEMRGPDVVLMNEPLRIAPDEHSIIIMKDGHGRFYVPVQDFCNIEFWNLEEGYRFNLDRDSEVTWTGGQIPFDADIGLREGWNIVAYYPTFELDASAPDFYVLSNIIDNVILAKDGGGHFMVPIYNYSNLPPWLPTRGYQIQTDADVVLNYPEEQHEQALAIPQMQDYPTDTGRECRWYLPPQSDRNMSVLVISISPDVAENGDEIGAFDLSGELVGAGVVRDGSCGLAVWGDVPDSEAREGLFDGEAFELRLWDADVEIEKSLEIGSIVEGRDGTVYQKDNLLVLKVLVREETVPESFLSDAFPNPFNAVTVLSYGISTHSRVVINVYDLRGVLVETLISSDHPAGSYRVTWNGNSLPSGVYIISMRSREFFSVRKVVLLR